MIDRLGQGFRGDYSILQPLLQRVSKAVRIRYQLVKGVAALSGDCLDRLYKTRFIGNSLIQQLFPAGTKTPAEKLISCLSRFADHAADGIGNFGQELFCFFKVANQNLPRRGPSRLRAFLQRVPQLRERLYFGSSIFSCLCHLSDLFCLGLGETLLNQIRLGIGSGKLLQCLSQDFSSKPFAPGKRLPEGTIHVDGILRPGAQQFGGPHQSILEHLAAHTGIDHRVPVHQGHSARSQRLGKLIHGRGGLLRSRARDSGQVRDTFDGVDRSLKIHAGRGKGSDIPGHLGEIVDRLIRIGIQLVQRPVDLLKIGPLMLGVGQNSLNCADLGFILLKTGFDRVNRKGGHKLLTCV